VQAFVVLLPIGLGVALSSVPITAILIFLGSTRARQSAPAFVIGYGLGLAIVTFLFAVGVAALPSGRRGPQDEVVGAVEIVLGVGLVGYGIWMIAHRKNQERTPGSSRLKRLETLGPIPAAGVGLVLNIRPKSLVLAVAAGIALGSSGFGPAGLTIAFLIYLAIGLSSVVVPLIVYFRSSGKAVEEIARGRRWITRNGHVVTVVVVLMLGAVLIGAGIATLTS
jgi:threonine/homoserine/homoserine lactone efflux protein